MIDLVLKLLQLDDFKGVSKEVDFAKGSDRLPLSFGEAWKQFKRRKAWLLRR